MKMRPNRIQDLIAANALYRPGPMEYIDDYVARKHGQAWTTPHPVMTEVLSETYGIMVYQEQVSRMVNRLGGLELKRAFRLAKLISKKKTDQIAQQQEPSSSTAASRTAWTKRRPSRSSTTSSSSAGTPSTRRTPPATPWSRSRPRT
jgi:DNA polymerase-3 subunit alpha